MNKYHEKIKEIVRNLEMEDVALFYVFYVDLHHWHGC